MKGTARDHPPVGEPWGSDLTGGFARQADIQTIDPTTTTSQTNHVIQTTASGAGANPSGGQTRLKLATMAPTTEITMPRNALITSSHSLRVALRERVSRDAFPLRSSSWTRVASALLATRSIDALIEVKSEPPSTTHNRSGNTDIPHLVPSVMAPTTDHQRSIIGHAKGGFHHGVV